MPGDEIKTAASKFTHSHTSGVLIGLVGIGMLVIGYGNPDMSDKIVQAVVGGVVTLIGALQAQRVGLTKKLDQQQAATQETVSSTMDKAYSEQMLTVTQAIVRMGTGMETLSKGMATMEENIEAKHEENLKAREEDRKAHESLSQSLISLAADKDTAHEEHRRTFHEHRELIDGLMDGQKTLGENQKAMGQQMGDVAKELGRLAEKIDQGKGDGKEKGA